MSLQIPPQFFPLIRLAVRTARVGSIKTEPGLSRIGMNKFFFGYLLRCIETCKKNELPLTVNKSEFQIILELLQKTLCEVSEDYFRYVGIDWKNANFQYRELQSLSGNTMMGEVANNG